MLRRIRAALRSDRGEASAVSVVLGTLLFLTASTGAVAVVGNIMAATAVTRQNAIIESALKQQLQDFQSSSWDTVETTGGPETVSTTYGGLTFPITTRQAAYVNPTIYIMQVAAPMATANGRPTVNCAPAVSTNVPGCLRLSAVRMASPQEEADYALDGSIMHAVAGLAVGPKTVDTTQKALNIITVTPASVLSSDPVRIMTVWNGAGAPTTVKYGFYCGTSATPVAQYTATSQTYNGTTSLIMELKPATLNSISGCTTANVGLSAGSAAVPAASIGDVAWWRVLPTKGAPE